ncbi:DNA mismatch repair protein MutS [Geomonas limicola]|uniref:DNA mismatch repair protein MutS n=1 Tax=Geomonas limicola TaxID=2740186 RepID=A0A6V8NBV6_9BACT|nr:Smr/MutS family protein [Geomonas limicola]GFO70102.1 DNA mismatch repair protein MutS [Geomonas limicola]
MKKKDKPTPKPKEFSASPFKALKGVTLETREQPPAAASHQKPTPPKPPKQTLEQQKQKSREELEDALLFLDAFADIRPMNPVKSQPHREKAKAVKEQKDDEEMRVFLKAVESLKLDVRFSDENLEPPPQQPVAVNRLRQVRRGGIRIDFQLDLHGLTRDEAIENLERFVRGAYNRGQKGVLVITGKGNNSPGEPVLKIAVGNWLREAGKAMVSEFVAAPSDLGGAGAFVVFLKEKKPEEPASKE